ncbi:MAG: lipocalin family protein [Pseudomonadota bacterium]|nr:lipocalin family protein [Pseudomonadota bacterium]MEE3291825.1 lipocalin family protein [Pseudomonadota bacterium]
MPESKYTTWLRRIILGLFLIGSPTYLSATVPLQTVGYVDLERFMGKWYVIACIPTILEKNIFNATETYQLERDGTISTTFAFRKRGFDGPKKEFHPRGFVQNRTTNAIWGMQFIWPIKADYRIIHLDSDYSSTIVGRQKRDYVWIMARQPQLSESLYQEMVNRVFEAGYDINRLVRIPQYWP